MGGCEARTPCPPRNDRFEAITAAPCSPRNGLVAIPLDDAQLDVGVELVAAVGGHRDRRGIAVADEALVRVVVEPREPGGQVALERLDARQPRGIEAAREGRRRGAAR